MKSSGEGTAVKEVQVRWLRAHAAEYHIDPKRVGVWGLSAGGHLVAMLGTTGNIRDFDVGENLDPLTAASVPTNKIRKD